MPYVTITDEQLQNEVDGAICKALLKQEILKLNSYIKDLRDKKRLELKK